MKISDKVKKTLIEAFEEKYEHNKYILSMDGRHIHYDREDLEELKKQQKSIRQLLEELRKEN